MESNRMIKALLAAVWTTGFLTCSSQAVFLTPDPGGAATNLLRPVSPHCSAGFPSPVRAQLSSPTTNAELSLSPMRNDDPCEQPSRRHKLRRWIRKLLHRSAALLLLAATLTCAPFRNPSEATAVDGTSALSRTAVEDRMFLFLRDDILGDVPPVRIPHPRRGRRPNGCDNPHGLDLFGDAATVSIVAESVVAKTPPTMAPMRPKIGAVATGGLVVGGTAMGARVLLQGNRVHNSTRSLGNGLSSLGINGINGFHRTEVARQASENTTQWPPKNPPRSGFLLTAAERNRTLERNYEILDLVHQIKRRREEQERAEERLRAFRAGIEAETQELRVRRQRALEALERIDARRRPTTDESVRSSEPVPRGIDRIQRRLRDRRRRVPEEEKDDGARPDPMTAERRRKKQIQRDQKLERTRRQMMQERLYRESLIALRRKLEQREAEWNVETERQRRDFIAKYGSNEVVETPIVPPAVGQTNAAEPAADVPFFATIRGQTIVLSPHTSTNQTAEDITAKPRQPATAVAIPTDRIPTVVASLQGENVTEKSLDPPDSTTDAQVGTSTEDDIATMEETQEKVEASLAMEGKITPTSLQKQEPALEPTMEGGNLKQQPKREATWRSLLKARLAMEARTKVKASSKEDLDQIGTSTSLQSRAVISETTFPQEQNKDFVSSALGDGRTAYKATIKASGSEEADDDYIMLPMGVDAALEAKQKAEKISRSLMEARFVLEGKSKNAQDTKDVEQLLRLDSGPKVSPVAAAETESRPLVDPKMAMSIPSTATTNISSRQRDELTSRLLLERRLAMESNARKQSIQRSGIMEPPQSTSTSAWNEQGVCNRLPTGLATKASAQDTPSRPSLSAEGSSSYTERTTQKLLETRLEETAKRILETVDRSLKTEEIRCVKNVQPWGKDEMPSELPKRKEWFPSYRNGFW